MNILFYTIIKRLFKKKYRKNINLQNQKRINLLISIFVNIHESHSCKNSKFLLTLKYLKYGQQLKIHSNSFHFFLGQRD